MTAITWGFGGDDTAERLMEESDKARANGKSYAELTARNAALAAERRRPRRQRIEEHGRCYSAPRDYQAISQELVKLLRVRLATSELPAQTNSPK